MKRWAVFFGLFIVAIIILADEGRLGPLYRLYNFPYGDKAGHFLLYGLLSLVVNLSVFEARPAIDLGKLALATSLVLALLIGLEEYSQRFFPTRTSDWVDLAAGYLGVALFAWLAVRLKQQNQPRNDP